MTPKEAKHLRTMFRVIQDAADERNQRLISRLAGEGLSLVKNLSKDGTKGTPKLLKVIPMNEIKPFVKR